jgi:hypothetical protein
MPQRVRGPQLRGAEVAIGDPEARLGRVVFTQASDSAVQGIRRTRCLRLATGREPGRDSRSAPSASLVTSQRAGPRSGAGKDAARTCLPWPTVGRMAQIVPVPGTGRGGDVKDQGR